MQNHSIRYRPYLLLIYSYLLLLSFRTTPTAHPIYHTHSGSLLQIYSTPVVSSYSVYRTPATVLTLEVDLRALLGFFLTRSVDALLQILCGRRVTAVHERLN